MKVLAVTGGIGSGKTHILKIFSALGIPVYNADQRTKELYNIQPALIEKLKKLLGNEIVVDGLLQKKIMAEKIFSNSSLLYRVENIVHPFVIGDFIRWKTLKAESRAPFLILESAIFLEKSLFYPLADKVLAVSAPMQLRIERVQKRDNLSKEEILKRVNNQWTDMQREEKADYVIYSDENHALLPQVLKIYNELKK